MTIQDLNVVGKSIQRRDGMGHVTGTTTYVDDIKFRDMLHLKMVRSPVPHARILDVDFSEAEKVPGFVQNHEHTEDKKESENAHHNELPPHTPRVRCVVVI